MFPICIFKWIDKFTKHLIIPKIVIMNSQDPDSQFPCIPAVSELEQLEKDYTAHILSLSMGFKTCIQNLN